MSAIPWILISVAVLIIILAVIAVILNRGKKQQTDYYSFFIMGITWLPIGILFQIFIPDSSLGIIFIGLGAVYMAIGLAHKKDWKKNHKKFSQLSSRQQKLKLIISIILGILVLVGLVAYYFLRGM